MLLALIPRSSIKSVPRARSFRSAPSRRLPHGSRSKQWRSSTTDHGVASCAQAVPRLLDAPEKTWIVLHLMAIAAPIILDLGEQSSFAPDFRAGLAMTWPLI